MRARTVALAALALAAPTTAARGEEGMWLPNAFPSAAVKKAHGFSPDAAWLDRARLASVRIAGGCSASFVSPDGLVLTNHHCVRECVESLSSAKRNFMTQGFVAAKPGDELACPDFELDQLVAIEDVTARVQGATRGLPDSEWARAQKAEMARIEKACAGDDAAVRCDVVTLYQGGRYDLYKYKRFRDARLVFAPELEIASFGGDPDNFSFPRYDLDVAFVRAYEGGKPARTPAYFTWSADGPAENELVFVSGHPGRTQRMLTVAELEFLRDVDFPERLRLWSEQRGFLTEFARRGPEQARVSEVTLYGIENSLKRGIGQHAALLDPAVFGGKVAAEKALRAKVARNPKWKKAWGSAWDEIAAAEARLRPLRRPLALLEHGGGFWSGLFGHARLLVRAAEEREKPSEQRLREYRDSALPSLEQRVLSPAPISAELDEAELAFSLGKLRELLGADDEVTRLVLGKKSPDELARELVRGSKLGDPAVRKALWQGGRKAVAASKDPMIAFAKLVDPAARAVRKRYEDEVEGPLKKNAELVAQAVVAAGKKGQAPDATFTLRISYGRARGYDSGGDRAPYATRIAGAFERATGRPPFVLPASWLAAEKRLDGARTMNFIYDCDTIGGNSGSPVVNRDAKVVGLNFDSNLFALGRAFQYDPVKGRSVAVSTAAITEALRVIYKAERLLAELGVAR